MARWLNNAPHPGAWLGAPANTMIKPGQEFSTPDDPADPFFQRPRSMWIPKDAAARALVAKWNAEHPSSRFAVRKLNFHNLPGSGPMPWDLKRPRATDPASEARPADPFNPEGR
jgi:hypothetical protein